MRGRGSFRVFGTVHHGTRAPIVLAQYTTEVIRSQPRCLLDHKEIGMGTPSPRNWSRLGYRDEHPPSGAFQNRLRAAGYNIRCTHLLAPPSTD